MKLFQLENKITLLEEENAALKEQIVVTAKHYGKTLEKLEETEIYYREYEEIAQRSYAEKEKLLQRIVTLEKECEGLRCSAVNSFMFQQAINTVNAVMEHKKDTDNEET